MMAADATSRMGDMRVADLMTIDPITVAIDATIEEAEELMRRHHVTGLPVVDDAGRLIGVISQTDILFLDVPGGASAHPPSGAWRSGRGGHERSAHHRRH